MSTPAAPYVWGPHLWQSIHYIARYYPTTPTPKDKADYRLFFENLGTVIPCFKCQQNYAAHLRELPIDGYLEGPEKLFEWTVQLHNIVNRQLGKRDLPLEQARTLYAHGNRTYQISETTLALVLSVIAAYFLWQGAKWYFPRK